MVNMGTRGQIDRGTRGARPLIPPPNEIPNKRVSKASKEYVELVTRERQAAEELGALEARKPAAIKSDLDRDAALVRERKPAVGPRDEVKLEADVTSARRSLAVLRAATDSAIADLEAVIEEERPSVLDDLGASRERTQARILERLDELLVLWDEVERLESMRRWAATFPGKRYAIARPPVELPIGAVDLKVIVDAVRRRVEA